MHSATRTGTSRPSSPAPASRGAPSPGFPSAGTGKQDDTAQMPHPGHPQRMMPGPRKPAPAAARAPETARTTRARPFPACRSSIIPGAPHRGRCGSSPKWRRCIYVILRDRRTGFGQIFEVQTGTDQFMAVVNGTKSISITNGQVLIDITDGSIKHIAFE